LRTNDDNTSRHGKYDYEQYGINKIEQQRIQAYKAMKMVMDKDDRSWKYPGEHGRVPAGVKRTHRDLELEKDIYGHPPPVVFKRRAEKGPFTRGSVLRADGTVTPLGARWNKRCADARASADGAADGGVTGRKCVSLLSMTSRSLSQWGQEVTVRWGAGLRLPTCALPATC
jgi:hypothetical protein